MVVHMQLDVMVYGLLFTGEKSVIQRQITIHPLPTDGVIVI